jgi:hypothetical protein
MRLTTAHRDAFVRAVMDDVPSIDYQTRAEEIVRALAVNNLPPPIQAIWKERLDLRVHIAQSTYVNLPYPLHGRYMPADPGELPAEVDECATLLTQQKVFRNDLRQKLSTMIAACSTLASAHKNLPEFAKYLPAEVVPTKNLPAVANVVAELSKAGWPKDA